jgi:NADH-quinone oxidoreductase subunit J
VLFLFVVMMLDVEYAAIKQGFTRYLPLGVLAAVMVFGLIWWMVKDNQFAVVTVQEHSDIGTVAGLGNIIYTEHFYPFELAAVILLIAIVAAISLTFRGTRMRKTQDVGRQLLANKEDRLRIVKMPAVKKTEGEQA